MLFKRFTKGLIGLMIFTMMGSMTFASETVDGPTEVFVVGTVSESEESVPQEVIDYELEQTNRAKEILEKGVLLNQSITKDNITFTLVGLYSDSYTYHLVCSLEKVDKSAFSDEESMQLERLVLGTKEEIEEMINHELNGEVQEALSYEEMIKQEAEKDENLKQFIHEDGTVDIEGVDAYYEALYASEEDEYGISAGGYGSSWGTCELEDSSDSKMYFLLEGSYNEPLPREMQLFADKLVKGTEKTEEVDLDLVAYLKENENVKPITKHNEDLDREREWLEEMDKDDEEYQYWKEDLERIPEQILERKDLGLNLCDNPLVPTINSIGFINNQLHILLTRECEGKEFQDNHRLVLQQEDGTELMAVWNTSSGSYGEGKAMEEDYYVFDIANIEALSTYSLSIISYGNESIAEGPWLIDVMMQPTEDQIIKELSQDITYQKKHKATLKRLELTPLSLTLHLEAKDKGAKNTNLGKIILNMKDGTTLSVEHDNASWGEKNQFSHVYELPKLLDSVEDVESITIDGKTIQL